MGNKEGIQTPVSRSAVFCFSLSLSSLPKQKLPYRCLMNLQNKRKRLSNPF
jgi:hypothetical protein